MKMETQIKQKDQLQRSDKRDGDFDRGGGSDLCRSLFFLVPSQTSVSSISGLGIVLSNFIPLPLSAITMILNVVLLIIGFLHAEKSSV